MSVFPRARKGARRAAIVSGAAGLIVLVVAAPASAHVTVSADDTTQGAGDAILTFRVPNEQDAAVTTKIDIKFPTTNPIASIKPAPKSGWTVTTKTVTFATPIKTDDGTLTEGVGEVIYTAKGNANGIPVGGFEAFQILVGPLPDAGSVAFPTVQTYSNGKTSSWIEPVTDPSTPPDNPAPVLTLTSAGDTGAQPGTTATAAASNPAQATGSTTSAAGTPGGVSTTGYATASQVDSARTLGIIGILIGAVGVIVGAVGLMVARRRRQAPAEDRTMVHS